MIAAGCPTPTVINSEPVHAWIELNINAETAFATDVTYELTLTVPGTAAHVITVVRRRTLGPQMVLAADRPARQTS